MPNIENLRTPTTEEAKEMQKKSVEARHENTIKRKLIEAAIRKELTDEDLHDIARGIIRRAKECTSDLVALRDTLGEKPVDEIKARIVSPEDDASLIKISSL